jgi:hypothetical protein
LIPDVKWSNEEPVLKPVLTERWHRLFSFLPA